MKIRQVGAKLLQADRRTDMAKLTVAFRNFANAPKNLSSMPLRPPPILHGLELDPTQPPLCEATNHLVHGTALTCAVPDKSYQNIPALLTNL